MLAPLSLLNVAQEKSISVYFRMAARNWIIYITLFIGGTATGLGILYINFPRTDEAASVRQVERAGADAEILRLRRVNADLTKQISDLHSKIQSVKDDSRKEQTLARLAALTKSGKSTFTRNYISLLTYDGEIDEMFAQIYDLSPEERETLAKCIATARNTLNQLEASHTTVSQISADKIQLSVQPFAVEGGKIYDQAVQQVAATLGPERYEAFLKLSGDSLDNSLGSFGARDRKVTITKTNGDGIRYQVVEETRAPNSTGNSNSAFTDDAQLRDYLKGLAPLYFSQKSPPTPSSAPADKKP